MNYLVPFYDFIGQRILITGDPGSGKSLTAYCAAFDVQRSKPGEIPLYTNLTCHWPGPKTDLATIRELYEAITTDGPAPYGSIVIWEELQQHCSTLAPTGPNVKMLYTLITEIRKWRFNFLATAPEADRVSGVIRGMISLYGKALYNKPGDHITLPLRDKYDRPQKTMEIFRPSTMWPHYDTHQRQSQRI